MNEPSTPEKLVIDASAVVDLLAGTDLADSVRDRLQSTVLHAPAHIDAEVFSALGRLHRAGQVSTSTVDAGLSLLTAMPVTRHPVTALLSGAWSRRADLRLVDALYVELAASLDIRVLTTDLRLSRACPVIAEAITVTDSGR